MVQSGWRDERRSGGQALEGFSGGGDDVNTTVIDQMADAAAYAVLTFAMNTEGVDGERGKGNSKPSKVERELAPP